MPMTFPSCCGVAHLPARASSCRSPARRAHSSRPSAQDAWLRVANAAAVGREDADAGTAARARPADGSRYATAAALEVLSKVGNTEDENIKTTLLTSEKEEINTIQASNDAGARDGISGKGDLYVDGMDISVHIGILKELETICKI